MKSELSSLFSIHKIENEFFKKFIKIKNVQKNSNNQNINNNLHSSLNSFTYNSISKTTVSNICNNNNNNSNNNNNIFSNNTLSKSINNNDNNINKIFNNDKDINFTNNPNNNTNNNINSNVINNIDININTNNNNNINKIKIIKIKQEENCKNIPEENLKIYNECGFIKKKYHINKNNFNKDIFKLINDESNYLFFSKNSKTPKIGDDSEKNAN